MHTRLIHWVCLLFASAFAASVLATAPIRLALAQDQSPCPEITPEFAFTTEGINECFFQFLDYVGGIGNLLFSPSSGTEPAFPM
jgi:hypothetical protein